MKVGIIYATHFGYCSDAAKQLRKKLESPSEIISFDYKGRYDLSEFDALVLGGSIRMGLLDQDFIGWLHGHKDEIIEKPYALFLACGFSENFDDYVKNCFPKEIVEHALAIECVGGNLEGSYKFYDKWLVKMMANKLNKEGKEAPRPLLENLETIATAIDGALQSIPQDSEEPED